MGRHPTPHALLTCSIQHQHACHHQHRVPVEHVGAAIPGEATSPVLAPRTDKGHAAQPQAPQEGTERQERQIQHHRSKLQGPGGETGAFSLPGGSLLHLLSWMQAHWGGATRKGKQLRWGGWPHPVGAGRQEETFSADPQQPKTVPSTSKSTLSTLKPEPSTFKSHPQTPNVPPAPPNLGPAPPKLFPALTKLPPASQRSAAPQPQEVTDRHGAALICLGICICPQK